MEKELEVIIETGLKELFDKKRKSFGSQLCSPQRIINILKKMGADVDEDFDTNGWQVDYWMYFTFNDEKYMVSGTMYDSSIGVSLDN